MHFRFISKIESAGRRYLIDSRPYENIAIHLVVIMSKITSSEAKFRTLPKILLTALKAAFSIW